ncbi:glutamine synthetase [Loktanella sp. D2R18]|uniref:glutamine synthetase family protein n=1 Tax=Rhodobacterales TaxID=204455 RepID=UPI000DE8E825|nr:MULTISPECIES: glutamine synthetase family protein [Rhodobacterales]MDO6590216.1 glutamine synthetase family protein [Yoonia sp. 1_MG-2023]RBW42964.1 glutamine synthetase [Loktanella sp. D2R18]
MTSQNAQDWLGKNPDVNAITIALCDINGVLRGKRVPLSQLEKLLSGGMRMPQSACTVDIWGHDIEASELVFESGDGDGVCNVTERGIIGQSEGKNASAMFQVMLTLEDGTPMETDPRQALAKVVKRLSDKGFTAVVATELEFYLTTVTNGAAVPPTLPNAYAPTTKGNVLSVAELTSLNAFLDDVYAACRVQNIPADAAISEGGAGQFEINLLHSADPLKAADDALLFKNVVKDTARKHGFCATFMAKPFGDQPGNGMHVHFSMLDADGNNIFDDGTGMGSDTLRFAVAGLLTAMQESTLIFAPHQNSYRRMRPNSHAPTSAAWGYENRTCAIRIPGGPNAARRIEHRVAGADTNPYLVLATILGSALNGIDAQLEPAAPVTGNAYDADAPSLPMDWMSAITAFAQGEIMADVLGPQMVRLFAQAKQQELQHFLSIVPDAEYHTYLETV